MFETKLANSIQQDYRQAADAHRFAKAADSKSTHPALARNVIVFGSLLTIFTLLF